MAVLRVAYKNETSDPISNYEAGNFAPGQSKTLPYFLAFPGNLTLVTYEKVSPVKDLHHAAPADMTEPLTGLSGYKQIDIRNKSGDVIEIAFNGDNTDILYMLDGEIRPFLQEEHNQITIEALQITGSGEGPVYVTGWKRYG